MSDKEFKEVAPLIPDSTRAVASFITKQVDRLRADGASGSSSSATSNEDIDESEDTVPEF